MNCLSLMVLVAVGYYAGRAWIRSALARQTAQDAAALAEYKFGRYHSSPAMAAPYDHAKAVQAHQRQTRRAAHARAKSRKVQDGIAAVPATAMRRVK